MDLVSLVTPPNTTMPKITAPDPSSQNPTCVRPVSLVSGTHLPSACSARRAAGDALKRRRTFAPVEVSFFVFLVSGNTTIRRASPSRGKRSAVGRLIIDGNRRLLVRARRGIASEEVRFGAATGPLVDNPNAVSYTHLTLPTKA